MPGNLIELSPIPIERKDGSFVYYLPIEFKLPVISYNEWCEYLSKLYEPSTVTMQPVPEPPMQVPSVLEIAATAFIRELLNQVPIKCELCDLICTDLESLKYHKVRLIIYSMETDHLVDYTFNSNTINNVIFYIHLLPNIMTKCITCDTTLLFNGSWPFCSAFCEDKECHVC